MTKTRQVTMRQIQQCKRIRSKMLQRQPHGGYIVPKSKTARWEAFRQAINKLRERRWQLIMGCCLLLLSGCEDTGWHPTPASDSDTEAVVDWNFKAGKPLLVVPQINDQML